VRGGAGQSGGEERTSRWERRDTVMRREGGHTNFAGEYSTWCDAEMVASLTLYSPHLWGRGSEVLPFSTWMGLDMLSSELLPVALMEMRREPVQFGGASSQETLTLG